MSNPFPMHDPRRHMLCKGMSDVFNPKHFLKASLNPIGEMKKERALPGQGGTKHSHEVWDRYLKATVNPNYQFKYTEWKDKTGRWAPKATLLDTKQPKKPASYLRTGDGGASAKKNNTGMAGGSLLGGTP